MTNTTEQPSASTTQERTNPTITEYVLVVLVMGMIGVMAVPKGSPTAPKQDLYAQAATERLCTELDRFRAAIVDYYADHGVLPGYVPGQSRVRAHGRASEKQFTLQLTRNTNGWGQPGSGVRYPFDPVLWEGVPVNPVNGLDTVLVLDDETEFESEADGTTGWTYKPLTGELRANCRGRVESLGKSYWEL